MINILEDELTDFLSGAIAKTFKLQEIISTIPNEILFINKGIIRALITDHVGVEHTILY